MINNIIFLQTKEAAIKALVELDDQGGKDKFNIIYTFHGVPESFR